MHKIAISHAKDVVRHVVIRMNKAVFFWGQPGAGKTQLAQQVADEMGAHLVDIRLGQYDSVDLRGFPSVAEDGTTQWHVPSTLPFKNNPRFDHIPDSQPILIVFDEMNAAVAAVSGVAYQIVQERRCGEHELRDNVRILSLGNREEDRGVTNRQPTPLSNRFTHYEIGVDADEVCFHFNQKGVSPVGVAFLQFRKNLVTTFDPKLPQKAFATPRSWETALQYYADPLLPEHIKQASIAGAIGDGPAGEFWGFVEVWRKIIPISKVLADPKGCPVPDEMSMLYAMAVSVSGAMTLGDEAKKIPSTVGPLHTYLVRLGPEFAVLAWKLAISRDKELFTSNEYLDFAQRYKQVWQA